MKSLFRLLAFPVALSAQPSRWIPLNADSVGSHMELDSERLEVLPIGVSTWIRRRGGTPRDTTRTGKPYAYLMLRVVAKCDSNELAFGTYSAYSANGDALDSEGQPKWEFQSPVPESEGERLLKGICRIARQRTLIK
jgi:hypothetical protein